LIGGWLIGVRCFEKSILLWRKSKSAAGTILATRSNLMVANSYNLHQNDDATQFVFFSEGNKGRVMKAVIISPYHRNRWNLAFGDVQTDGEIDDSAMTNNNDVAKVMGTVAQAALLFSERHPDCSLVIYPVDEKRKWLYNLIFRRRLEEISAIFSVFGKRGRTWEAYNLGMEYDAFELFQKIRYF
jgi:hypothetical protein